MNDLRRVVAYGVMALPALVIDEKVVSGGSVLPVEEIMEIIRYLN
ncbi:MAG: thioredoxin family protein [Acidaminococcaceae bacterium]|nr:thioredoxin family protein [Acidaminococcaceae bacterium]